MLSIESDDPVVGLTLRIGDARPPANSPAGSQSLLGLPRRCTPLVGLTGPFVIEKAGCVKFVVWFVVYFKFQ